MLCEKCAKEIPDNSRFCPYCSEATAVASKASPATGSIPGSVQEGEATRVDFHDFQLRAWQADATHVQVMVHSSPVGGMRRPLGVKFDPDRLAAARKNATELPINRDEADFQRVIEAGQELAQVLLPSPVYTLLIRSLERIAPDDGLRLRLCLDESLVDLPWEFLYRPDAVDQDRLNGFLVLNPRISLVREAPTITHKIQPSRRKQRLVFAGTLWPGGEDRWEVKEEYRLLSQGLASVKEFLLLEDYISDSGEQIEKALSRPSDIFHFSGHTDEADGQGYLCKEIFKDPSGSQTCDKLYSEQLGRLLWKCGTRLAVFSACNSGRWTFMEPLLRAGVPALVGVQGLVTTVGAIDFCHKLYSSLAIGLSLDEAVTWARLHLLEAGVFPGEWGIFMVYLPTTEAVLFPQTQHRQVRERQAAARRERQQTIINVYQNIGSVIGGQVTGVSGNIDP